MRSCGVTLRAAQVGVDCRRARAQRCPSTLAHGGRGLPVHAFGTCNSKPFITLPPTMPARSAPSWRTLLRTQLRAPSTPHPHAQVPFPPSQRKGLRGATACSAVVLLFGLCEELPNTLSACGSQPCRALVPPDGRTRRSTTQAGNGSSSLADGRFGHVACWEESSKILPKGESREVFCLQ